MASRRRANGEGTVNERADGRWEARWTDERGARHSAYGKTQREALRKMREGLAHEARGLQPLTGESTVARFLADWLEQHVRPNREPGTYDQYRSAVKKHYTPAFGHLRLDKVTPPVVQVFVAGLRAGPYTDGTVWKLRTILAAAFAWGVGMKLLGENPVRPVKTPKAGPRVEAGSLMTEEEVAAFCRVIRGDRDEGIYLLGLLLGLRRGEVLGLSWAHIDLAESEARIVQQVQRQTGQGLVIKPLKSGRKGARTVPLGRRVLEALWARHAVELQDRQDHWTRWRSDLDGDRLVFRSRVGTPLEEHQIRRRFPGLLARLDLPPRRFHDLRHNAATLLFGQQVSPKLVQELLGHSSIGMTMDIYTHVPKGALRRATEGLEGLLEDK